MENPPQKIKTLSSWCSTEHEGKFTLYVQGDFKGLFDTYDEANKIGEEIYNRIYK